MAINTRNKEETIKPEINPLSDDDCNSLPPIILLLKCMDNDWRRLGEVDEGGVVQVTEEGLRRML